MGYDIFKKSNFAEIIKYTTVQDFNITPRIE